MTPPTTITARIYVAVDASGAWFAAGGSTLADDDAMDPVHSETGETRKAYWVTVTLPVPTVEEPVTIAASGVEAV